MEPGEASWTRTSRSDHAIGNGILFRVYKNVVLLALALAALIALLPAVADASGPAPTSGLDAASAARQCVVPKLTKLTFKQATAKLKKAGCGTPKAKRIYSSKIKAGHIIKQSPKAKKKVKAKFRVTVWLSLGKKLCIVKKKNSKGKLVTVYQTKLVKKKVRNKNGKLVTKKVRVFVYKYVTKKVKVKGKTVKKRVKVKVPKMGPCAKKKNTSAGIPVRITLNNASVAHVDFGAFVRDIPLSGTVKGFIVGKGFQLGKDNLIQISGAHISLAPTGIFIDDACNGEVSDAIRTDDHAYTELDQTSTSNTIRVKPDASLSGLLHMRIQVSLDMRNDETGCNDPYFTTGWTDFTIPLFLKGKIGAGKGGLVTTVTIGETVLDDLSACLAQGDPTQPCNGFAIPFPGIFSAEIEGVVKIG